MMEGLMERYLSHEMALERVCTKVKATEEELIELKAWKVYQDEKLKALKQLRGELERQVEELGKFLRIKRIVSIGQKWTLYRSI